MKYIEEATQIHPGKLALILSVFALAGQFVIVTYTHISGYYVNHSFVHFVFRWLFSSFISIFLLAMMVFPDVSIIKKLNNRVPWNRKALKRVIIEIFLVVVIGTIVAIFATTTMHMLHPYKQGLTVNIINNILIAGTINVIVTASLEGWFFFRESRIAKENEAKLQSELLQVQFEVLKNQLNPHFLFNSLNVLSGLITSNPQKAQDFIEEFSSIYYYILDTIEKKLVTLSEELDFANSYIFLQNLRYGDAFKYSSRVSAEYLGRLLPPLSLQTALENAFKHNAINSESPLLIEVFIKDNALTVENNLIKKIGFQKSSGIGLKNLERRYELICRDIPEFTLNENKYIIKLPLILAE